MRMSRSWGLVLGGMIASQVCAMAGGLSEANAASDSFLKDYLTVQSVEIREEESFDPVDFSEGAFSQDFLLNGVDSSDSQSLEEINWGEVVAIGEKIWDIVVKNRPISNIETKAGIHVIPAGLGKRWTQLEGWKVPAYKTYSVVYTNTYGMEVVRFKFTFAYNYNGNYRGKGRFLANVKVIPKEAVVSWGFQFNAKVVVDDRALNVGTAKQPVAGLGLQVQWKISTVVSDVQEARDIFVDGWGRNTITGIYALSDFGILN